MMTIRPMLSSDYEAVDRLMGQLHQSHVEGRPDLYAPLEHPYSREEFEEMLADRQKILLLGEEDGAAVGLCVVAIRDKSGMTDLKTAYMDDMVVDKAFRNRGYARQLFRAAEERARELGAVRLDLMVWSFNEAALSLYRELGMTPQRYILEKPL